MKRTRRAPRYSWHALGLYVFLVMTLTPLVGCDMPLGSSLALSQAHGLPTLHRLNWPSGYYGDAVWSPNGRWIAALVGPDYATSQLGVISPDGKYHRDLSGWGCGESGSFTFAWLPDNSLSCLSENGFLIIGAYPFTHPQSVSYSANLVLGSGGVWLQKGSSFIISSLVDPSDPTHEVHDAGLYVVRVDGTVIPRRMTPKEETTLYPDVSPQGARLSYLLETDPTTGNRDLMLSQLNSTAAGLPTLAGTPQTLATGVDSDYTWSPSGRWIAVRHLAYQGGDKIYLVNPDNPTQTVDVVLADQVGQQMMNPIWSPDGGQLIVFSVGFSTAQPYELDIGSYLASKGLQP